MSKESPASESRLPVIIGRFGLYATYVAAALFLLVIAGDLDVLLRHGPSVGWLAVLVGTGPLLAVLFSTLASYTNYYGVWRVLRRKDVYAAGQDLKSHAADAPQAAEAALAGRSGCLPAASMVLLFFSLLLAIAPALPPETPYVGALSTSNDHLSNPVLALSATTPTATTTPPATPTPTVVPSPTATAKPRPTATATATATPTPQGPVINFTISPSSKSFRPCAGNPTVQVPPATLTLDNSQSTVAVSWQVKPIDSIASGAPWATITDAAGTPVTSGTVAPGSTQTITVKPASILCKYTPPPMSWQVHFATANAGPYTFTYNVS